MLTVEKLIPSFKKSIDSGLRIVVAMVTEIVKMLHNIWIPR